MKKRIPALLLALALSISMLVTPASAFFVDFTSIGHHPAFDEATDLVLYVEKADGKYEELRVYDDYGNQYYVQTGENEWEKLDTPLPFDEVLKQKEAAEKEAAAAVAKKKAEMEKAYKIKFSANFGESMYDMNELEAQILTLPAPLREKVSAQLTKMGKTPLIEDTRYTNHDSLYYGGFYIPAKVQIEIAPFTFADSFVHEYGHMVFETVLPKLYNSSTLKKEWNALKGGEGPTHVTDYAKTSYNEDLAETFDYLIRHASILKTMAQETPDALVVKKAVHMRQVLNKAFGLDESVLPSITPSAPSAWAKADIEEYQRTLGGSDEGVVPAAGSAHATSYQAPATRVQFVYSMLNNLVEKLRSNNFFTGLSYEAYVEKWHPAARYLYIPEEFPFTDVTGVSENSAKAILSMYRNGVINGKSATTFDPQGQITRQEAATILYRLCNAVGYKLPKGNADNFADSAKIAPWAKDAVAAVSAAGIMNGVGNNNFAPTAVYSCEQSALTLLRTYNLLTK